MEAKRACYYGEGKLKGILDYHHTTRGPWVAPVGWQCANPTVRPKKRDTIYRWNPKLREIHDGVYDASSSV